MEIKVFISSTFKDLHDYRTFLVNNVYPKLERLCWEKNISFTYVDFRWGIAKSELDDIVKVCLNQIEKCYPFFVGIIGDRYGTIYDPNRAQILQDDFPKLYEDVVSNDGLSITEMEFVEGLFKNNMVNDNAFCYQLRTANSEFDERLVKFIDRVKNNGYPIKDFTNYDELEEIIIDDFERMLSGISDEDNLNASLSRNQNRIIQSKIKSYQKDVHLSIEVDRYLDFSHKTNKPLIIFGESGCGKTTYVADTIKGMDKRNFVHFVGLEGSHNEEQLVRKIIENYHLPIDCSAISVKKDFIRYIETLEEELIIMIDGINQIEFANNKIQFDWLPAELPSNVKIVITCTPIASLKKIVSTCEWHIIEMNGFDENRAKEFITHYLSNMYSKELSEQDVIAFINGASKHYMNPFYLKNVIDEMVKVIAWINVEEMKVFINNNSGFDFHFVNSINDLINFYMSFETVSEFLSFMMGRLENIYRKEVFINLVTTLANSRSGFSFEELFVIVCKEDEELYPYLEAILIDLDHIIVKVGEKYMLSHSQFETAVLNKYSDRIQSNRSKIIQSLEIFDVKNYEEILFQCSQLYRWNHVKDLLEHGLLNDLLISCDRSLLMRVIEAVDFVYGVDAILDTHIESLMARWEVSYQNIEEAMLMCFELGKYEYIEKYYPSLIQKIKISEENENQIIVFFMYLMKSFIESNFNLALSLAFDCVETFSRYVGRMNLIILLILIEEMENFSSDRDQYSNVSLKRLNFSKKKNIYATSLHAMLISTDNWNAQIGDGYEHHFLEEILLETSSINALDLNMAMIHSLYRRKIISTNNAITLSDNVLLELPIFTVAYADALIKKALLFKEILINDATGDVLKKTFTQILGVGDLEQNTIRTVDTILDLIFHAMVIYEYHSGLYSKEILNCIKIIFSFTVDNIYIGKKSEENISWLYRLYKLIKKEHHIKDRSYLGIALKASRRDLRIEKGFYKEPYINLSKIVNFTEVRNVIKITEFKTIQNEISNIFYRQLVQFCIGAVVVLGLIRADLLYGYDNMFPEKLINESVQDINIQSNHKFIRDKLVEMNMINGIISRTRVIYTDPIENKNIYSFNRLLDRLTVLYHGTARMVKSNDDGDFYFLDENRWLCQLGQKPDSKTVIIDAAISDYNILEDAIVYSLKSDSHVIQEKEYYFMNAFYSADTTDLFLYDVKKKVHTKIDESIQGFDNQKANVYYARDGQIIRFDIKNRTKEVMSTKAFVTQCIYVDDDNLVYIDAVNSMRIKDLLTSSETIIEDFQVLSMYYDTSMLSFNPLGKGFVLSFINDHVDYELDPSSEAIFKENESYKNVVSYYIIMEDKGVISNKLKLYYSDEFESIFKVGKDSYAK